jgi:hypothetical protein
VLDDILIVRRGTIRITFFKKSSNLNDAYSTCGCLVSHSVSLDRSGVSVNCAGRAPVGRCTGFSYYNSDCSACLS